MSGAHSVQYNHALKQFKFSGYLTLHPEDGVKFTAKWPNARPNSRVMAVNIVLPETMFKTPELKLNVTVDDPSKGEFNIDVDTVAEALSPVIGADIVVSVGEGAQ